MSELGLSERQGELLEAIFTYLYRGRHGESVRSILETLPSNRFRRAAMTIADRLERKGRLEGKREGRIDNKRELLGRHFERKFGLTEHERKHIRSQKDPKLQGRRSRSPAVALARSASSTPLPLPSGMRHHHHVELRDTMCISQRVPVRAARRSA
jgi:hypothetical protein